MSIAVQNPARPPPPPPEFHVNQIARQLNAGTVLPGQGPMLAALASSIQDTLRHVREALGRGKSRMAA